MWMSMSGDEVVDGVVVVLDLSGAVVPPVEVFRGAVVETGAGGTVRGATDRDEVDEDEARRDVVVVAVVRAGAGVTV
jgi:hypothetical protein